jgi:hypothetical protein
MISNENGHFGHLNQHYFSLFLRYFPLLWELREAMRSLMRLGKKGLF